MYINYLAVVVCAVVYFMLGGLWYSKLLFAKPWMSAIGKTEEELKGKGGAGLAYVVAIISALVTAFLLSVFIYFAGVDSLASGTKIGFYAWLGFSVTTLTPVYFFEQRPKKLLVIYAGYTLVAFLIMGAILGVWR